MARATVRIYDPQANENARRAYPDLDYADSLADAVQGADIVALLKEWDEFSRADPELLGRLVSTAAPTVRRGCACRRVYRPGRRRQERHPPGSHRR
jgi:UDP-glucose 6-dehydrogenase